MTDRAQRLAELLQRDGLDALLVTAPVNVRWLTGFTGSAGIAVVSPGGTCRFITDFRYEQQAAAQLGDGWAIEIAKQDLLKHFAGSVAAPLKLGFDDGQVPVKQHAALAELLEGVELVAAGGLVESLREIKDAGEIEAIRAATQLADTALREVLERGLGGRSERDVALDLEFTVRRLGAEAVSFDPIVAHGGHGALPHAVPRDVAIEAGTLCVIDWGAHLDGYASDCTRTYAVGEPSPGDREIYDLVLAAQLESLAEVLPGASGKAIDAVARDVITSAGHGDHFGHGLGHGVGAEIHEEPRLSQRSDSILKPGMVVTVEPGIYVPGQVGVRIEDLVVVTADGRDVLTSLPKTLTVID
ncbi:MAG TPA: Xaa-Pro peptidase family protein [Baekduia sp.]|nr:Xaa-Pro peptidase family protein [Baekduia sp.]